jgi:hypothetical protein
MAPLDTLLTGLARERSTGALRVGRAGTVFLSEGRVTYMECAQTPGVERLLVAHGRASESALRRLQADGGCAGLLDEGVLTLGELQYCVLGAVLDAAFFLLPVAGTRPKFRPGERHWLGGQWYFDVAGLMRECARRRAYLAQVWESAQFDTAPVRLAPRLSRHAMTLDAAQWEVVAGADAEATPLDLAKRLGRSGYSILLAVRRLAAAGLLAPAQEAPAGTPRTPRHSATRAPKETPKVSGQAVALPRRVRGSADRRTSHEPGGPDEPPRPTVTAEPADLGLLMRLKKALEELS